MITLNVFPKKIFHLVLKRKKYVPLKFQNISQIVETSYSFIDSKLRRVALYCSETTTCIVRRNKDKTARLFLMFELSSFS